MTDEDWQGDLDLKLFAAIRLPWLALPGMRERKWGRVVNVLVYRRQGAQRQLDADQRQPRRRLSQENALTRRWSQESDQWGASPQGGDAGERHAGRPDRRSDQWDGLRVRTPPVHKAATAAAVV